MYRYLIPVLIFVIVWVLMDVSNPGMKIYIKGFITASIAYILSPRIKEVNFLHGRNIQVKWFILGKVILFPLNDKKSSSK